MAIWMLSPGSRDLAVLHRGPEGAIRANFREERLCSPSATYFTGTAPAFTGSNPLGQRVWGW